MVGKGTNTCHCGHGNMKKFGTTIPRPQTMESKANDKYVMASNSTMKQVMMKQAMG
jgi:hypothetical protein